MTTSPVTSPPRPSRHIDAVLALDPRSDGSDRAEPAETEPEIPR
jgi:hypothetical protein